MAAAGRFAGGFLKREGRPTTREILTARVTDRPLRPLFPKGYKDEVQIQANVLAADGENDPSPMCCTGASAALLVGPARFVGSVARLRVGRIDGDLVRLASHSLTQERELDLIVPGKNREISLIEGFASQFPEDQMAAALEFAHRAIKPLCDL